MDGGVGRALHGLMLSADADVEWEATQSTYREISRANQYPPTDWSDL